MPTGAGPGNAPSAAAAGGSSSGSSSGGGGGIGPSGHGLGTGAPQSSYGGTGAVGGHGLGTGAPQSSYGSEGGLAGSQGHAQPKAAVDMDIGNADVTPESRAQAMADPIGYFSKTDIFGDTKSDQVNYAKQNKLRNITFHGDFGSTFGHVTGLAPHQSDRTSFADRTIPGDPEGALAGLSSFALSAIPGFAPVAIGLAKGAADAEAGLNTGLISMALSQVLTPTRSTTTPTRSTTTPTKSTTTPTKSTTTPVSVSKPKVKPNINLPQGYQGRSPGPNILEEEKKKGGRIKRKKNYSKGGGVRSANY